ncbi:hypothetical protein IAU60_002831 [Kwoniella sp. DSM 27419]
MAAASTTDSGEGSSSSGVPHPVSAFSAYLTHLTTALDSVTSHAAALPDKSDLSFHRTLDRTFAKDLDTASERVLKLTERLLTLVDQSQRSAQANGKGKVVKAKSRRRQLEDEDDVVDGFRQGVVGVVDGLLEDADSRLDDLRGEKKKAAIAVKPALAAAAGQKLPGPFTKERERLPAKILKNDDLPKPQLLFHDTVDNSPSAGPWRPSLTDKPHQMVPLDFEPPLDYELTREEEMDPSKEHWRREREIRQRLHPYFYETRHLPYPTSMFRDSPATPPRSFEDTPFTFVDTPEQLDLMVTKLKKAKEIAIDLEHHQMRSYRGFTCLMQISTREEDFVVDTLKLRQQLREDKLGDVLTDPAIIKVFHGAESDIVWLQQDFELYVVNLFDTYHASVVLGMSQRSLAALLQLYCNFEADKRYQMADWRIRPLPEAMMHYARSDTHFLLFIYDNLRNSLFQQSSRPPSPDPNGNEVIETTRRNPQQAMREVLSRSADTALKVYERDEYDEETGKGSGGWAQAARKWLPKGAIDEEPGWVWRKLHAWRDQLARDLDESPFFIMPQVMLRSLAMLRGTAPILVKQVVMGKKAPIVENHLDDLVRIIKEAKEEYAKAQAKLVEDGPQAKSASPAHPVQKVVKVAVESIPVPDVWDAVTAPPYVVKAAPKSGLFGSTMKANAQHSTSSKKPVKSASGLFGSTLSASKAQKGATSSEPRARLQSPGFEAVKRGLFDDLQPQAVSRPQIVEATADIGKSMEPEQVPFVPAAQRNTSSAQQVSASSEPAALSTENNPAEPPVAPGTSEKIKVEDGIVQVKKARKVKKRSRVGSTSVPNPDDVEKKPKLSPPAEGDEAVVTPATTEVRGEAQPVSTAVEKKKKKKNRVQDVPEFDYANEPNLLDQPVAVSSVLGGGKKDKKKKKDKKEQKGIGAVEIPTFGQRAARDMSQPKHGSKSGTFAE